MPDLLCPKCLHSVDRHDYDGCQTPSDTGPNFVCMCEFTEAQALRAAQRRAAIGHLKELAKFYRLWRGECQLNWQMRNAHMNGIKLVYEAYCAVGILGQRKADNQ